MTTWDEIAADAPALAAKVRARFEATGLAFIATLRKDGSPRISGIEPLFAAGELWLGMMDDSLKAHDLLRDPRLALHSASEDKQVANGDAKLTGRAVPAGTTTSSGSASCSPPRPATNRRQGRSTCSRSTWRGCRSWRLAATTS